ncbi:conserved hypothetical protein [Pediculus humanus corporis]|uniref:Gelsolin-like domain-containing protein n=1 Tax=Pediculus humanus subsp. corporis TaxID=121224 RepID=E0VAR0_PEDHC|nr:uncharacterized protein Phum_PHUM042690 [Pediculus humanus corporis]EEB10466.1 conserved hypothetical protein [Pediculus humanus corporis]
MADLRLFIIGLCCFVSVINAATLQTQRDRSRSPVKNKESTTSSSQNDLPVNRQQAANVFANAGKKAGLEIWRIENFAPVPVERRQFGKFYEGDSYIVLKTKESKGKFSWDIHFWLGDKTTQDESGSAAILAVELDDSLGGAPVQHRETQGHESQLFTSYFSGLYFYASAAIRYLTGGVKSGFTHVTPNETDGIKRLYQVKGKKDARIKQVEPSSKSMNKGDCFILDTGKVIYVYYGVGTSAGGDDEQFEQNIDAQVVLYKVSDASGGLKIEKVGEKPLSNADLNTNDAFILDTVTSGLYSWIGKRSTKAEKEEALKKAQEFCKSKNYPSWTRITRVIEGGEPTTFKQYFREWREKGDIVVMG